MERTTISSGKSVLNWHRAWRYAAVLGLGLGLGMLAQYLFQTNGTKAPAAATATPSSVSAGATAAAPPWGELETTEFSLDLSDDLLPRVQPLLNDSSWYFPGYSLEGVTNLLRSCQFSQVALDRMMDGVEWELTVPSTPARPGLPMALADLIPQGVWLSPSSESVFELSPSVRQRLYAVLATSEANPNHRFPFRFIAEDFSSLLAQAHLPSDKAALVRHLAYTNENTVCLADLEPLRHFLTSNEMKSVLKMAYQAPTFVMRLRLSPAADVEALARYWGRGGRDRVIRPFLQGLARSPGQPSISVSFMMPAFARNHLYTFPDPARDPARLQKQGLWSALNFFNDQPDNRYLNDDYARQALRDGFEATRSVPSYGDLIAVTSPTGDLLHVGVFIARDVVFTRNGPDSLQPWVLMRIPAMLEKFGSLEQAQPVTYHRKHA
jgi:hypothetical protein